MSFTIVNKYGIDIGSDRWAFTITGDPTSGAGLKAGIGSVAVQTDSVPANLFWDKTGPQQTDWVALSASGSAGVSAAASSDGSFRASAYSVPVDGTTDAVATLATLTGTTIPATGGPYRVILGPSETVKLASDVTLPATIQLVGTGGLVKPASGKVLTINAQPTGAGKMFDTSAGGTIVFGAPLTARPEWWGADRTGTTNSSPAVNAAMLALTGSASLVDAEPGIGGGRLYIPSGTYKMSDFGQQYGNGFSYVTIEGDGPSTLLINGTARTGSPDFRGIWSFFGNAGLALKQLRIRNLRLSGLGAADTTRMITCDSLEGLYFDNVSIENNAVEGIYSGSDDTTIRFASFSNCHAKNIGIGFNVAAFNLNAGYVTYNNCTFDACAIGIENMGRFTSVTGCLFKDTIDYGVMFQSTWSGFLDASFVQENTYGSVISNNQFVNTAGRAVLFPDFQGHANPSYPTHGPAHLDGGLGKLTVTSNVFDRSSVCVWGGADKKGAVDCSNNLFSGQYDAGSGPQNIAVCPLGGTWAIHNNTFEIGQGIKWVSLIGPLFAASKGDRMVVSDNVVINQCWLGANPGIRVFQDDTIKGTKFLDLDGTLPTGINLQYTFYDATNNVRLAQLLNTEWAWWDSDHIVSMYHEPTKLPLLGDALPENFSFKPGDTIINRGTTAKWHTKYCLTGGTTNVSALAITGAATSGTKTLTVSSAAALGRYMWLTFPGFPTVTNKQILSISGTTVTVDTAFEASVTAGATVSWATPQFVTDRDIASLSIASQATGDLAYASSATAWARLAKGNNGAYLSLASGVPAWVDAPIVKANVNSSTGIDVTWTPAEQEQLVTSTTATPAYNIVGIPSGGYLTLLHKQDATGGRLPTFTTSITGGIVWSGGSAPTLTTTSGKVDVLEFHNDGTRVLAYLAASNF